MDRILTSLDPFCIVNNSDMRLKDAMPMLVTGLELKYNSPGGITIDTFNEVADEWIRRIARRHPEIAFSACGLYLHSKEKNLLTYIVGLLRPLTWTDMNNTTSEDAAPSDRRVLESYLLWRHGLLAEKREVYITPTPSTDADLANLMENVRI